MADDLLGKLAKKLSETAKPEPKPERRKRTFDLREPQFSTLANYCREKGLHIQDVLDDLVSGLLDKLTEQGEIEDRHRPAPKGRQ
jgi:predicted RNase H-like nuclease